MQIKATQRKQVPERYLANLLHPWYNTRIILSFFRKWLIEATIDNLVIHGRANLQGTVVRNLEQLYRWTDMPPRVILRLRPDFA